MVFRRGDLVNLLRRRREAVAVVVLLLVALALRVYQVNWDQGHLYHPDERFILMSAAAIQLTLPFSFAQLVGPNPTLIPQNYSYTYGTFALYLLRIVASALVGLGQIFPFLHAFDNMNDLGNLRLVGRPLSALFDTGSVYLVYRLGRQLYGRRTAFLGAAFLTFAVIDIQLSHFYATDTVMTALVVASIVASVEFVRSGKTSSIVFAGIFCGLALATKASSSVVLAPFVGAHVARALSIEEPGGGIRARVPDLDALGRAVEGLILGGIFASLAFLLAEPYAVIDFNNYIGGILGQSDMVRGVADLPYTRQYFGRPPYLYFLQNLTLFGVGIPLGLAMIGGWIYAIVRNVLRPRLAELVVLVYVIPYFAITGDFYAKFLRYMLPITPFLALFAALGLVKLIDLARSWRLGTLRPDLALAGPATLRLPPELLPVPDDDGPDLAELRFFDGDDDGKVNGNISGAHGVSTSMATPAFPEWISDGAVASTFDSLASDAEVPSTIDESTDESTSTRSIPAGASPATNGHIDLDPITSGLGLYDDLEPPTGGLGLRENLEPTAGGTALYDNVEPTAGDAERADDLDPELVRWAELKGLSLTDLVGEATPRKVIDPEAERFARLKGLALDWFVEDEAETDGVPAPNGVPTRNGVSATEALRDDRAPRAQEWVEVPIEDEADPDTPAPRPLPRCIARVPSLAAFAATPWPTRLARGLAGLVLAFTAFYGLAFDHMYDKVSPPVSGSEWLYQHAPRGSVIATEHWEEGMPVPLQTATGQLDAGSMGYQMLTMPMYDDDNAQKLNTVVNNLEQANYIVFFSNRLYGTVPRIPARYPMSQRYYDDLFGGKLGFQLVDVGERYPNLLGVAFVDNTLVDPGLPIPPLIQHDRIAPITIDLGHADESFSVYDHQRVLIFQKTQQLTPDQLVALIGPAPAPGTTSPTGQVARYKSLVLTPAQEAIVRAGGTFHDLFNRDDLLNHFALPVWVLVIFLVGLGGLPFAFLALRFLPDRGYLLSRTLGTLLFVWLSWMIVSLGIVEATRPATLAILFGFLMLALGVGYLQRNELIGFLRRHRRLLLAEEGVFWVAFFYDVWVRAQNPDLWHPALGGEKPMDLAYFTAAARSPIYPPYDPWFAGGYLNYYYFGQIIVGTLTKVTGVLPTTSYNIVVPFLFALTVAGAFTAAYALIHRGAQSRRTAFLGGTLSALMVCVLGNLGGFLQLVGEVAQESTIHPLSALPGLAMLIEFLDGAVNILFGARPLVIPEDWYWASTRMLALLDLKGTGSINEFPYFTFLFADLHAHLIALPFTLLAIAFCVNIVKSGGVLAHLPELRLPGGDPGFAVETALPRPGTRVETTALGALRSGVAWSTVAAIGLAGLTAGALYPTNSWDYPTYVGLLGLSLAIPWYLAERRTFNGFLTLAFRFVVIVALSQLLFRPFYANFQSFYSGVHLSDEKSDLTWYFMIHGLFLVVMVSYFLLEGWARYRRSGLLRALRLYVGKWELLPRTLELQQTLTRGWNPKELLALYGVGVVALVVAVCFLLGMQVIGALLALLVVALTFGFRRDRSPEETFVVFLFATGLAIGIGTDVFTIDGDVGRMNTIFKFYEQVWVLFGVASAVALVAIVRRLGALRSVVTRRAWIGVIVAFFLMASIYPVLGTKSRVANRFNPLPLTLDGTAYMQTAQYDDDGHAIDLATDLAAIDWLQDHVAGTPTILETTRPLYRWGARISIYTGLPTVIGWDWHQKQQRWGYQDQVDQRVADVNTMYDDPSPQRTLALLHQYGVSYIIDGQLEQAFHPAARAKFDAMVGTSLEVVYDQNGVKIYRVK